MLLSDEEIEGLMRGRSTLDFGKAVQAAILAKLASAELPEPAMRELNPHLNSGHDPYNGATHLQWFTADQLRQAYAQGAAAQLSAEPVAETMCDCYPDHSGTIYAEAVLPRGTPLYTRKEASK